MLCYQFHLHNFAFFSLPPKPRKGRKLKENSIFYTFSWCGRKGERERMENLMVVCVPANSRYMGMNLWRKQRGQQDATTKNVRGGGRNSIENARIFTLNRHLLYFLVNSINSQLFNSVDIHDLHCHCVDLNANHLMNKLRL